MSELYGWNPVSYRLWYLTGAIVTAAYLGQGTIFLMAEKRLAKLILIALLLGSIAAGIWVFTAPVDLNSALASGSISGKGMPSHVRLLTPFFNIFGTVALVGGALKSSLNLVWKGGSKPRAGGTALIAVGALVVAFGGTLSRFSVLGTLYFTELAGISIIFGGYLLTGRKSVVRYLDQAEMMRRKCRYLRFRLKRVWFRSSVCS